MSQVSWKNGLKVLFLPSMRRIANGNSSEFGYYFIPMDIIKTIDQFDLQSELVALIIIGLAILLIVYVNRMRLLLRFREWRIQRCLNRIGAEQIRDFSCPDGLDGHYRIDRLALTRDAILVIAYKPYIGNIYCAERIAEWTQVIGQKSFKFENPMFELENQITALKLLIGAVPLRGYLMFDQSAEFPKGQLESILQPENIPAQLLRSNNQQIDPEKSAAWEQLKWQHANANGAGEIGVKT
jgi:hypothetical protein